jgi:hypothetical protein
MGLSWESEAATRGGRAVFPLGASGWHERAARRWHGPGIGTTKRLARSISLAATIRVARRCKGHVS